MGVVGYYFYNVNHWELYKDPLGRFEVELPVTPEYKIEETRPMEDVSFEYASYTAEVNKQLVYVINVTDYEEDVISDRANGLEVALDKLINARDGSRVVSSSMTTFDGFDAIKFELNLGYDRLMSQGYMIAKGSEFYQVIEIYRSNKFKKKDSERFFDSFKIKD